MPRIRELDAGADGLRPSETGIQAVAGAARRIGTAYNEAAGAVESTGKMFAHNLGSAIADAGAQVVKVAEHREINQGAANYAGLFDNLTQTWNEAAKNADPNDPTVAQNFREKVLEPQLEKFKDGFITEGGQKYAEGRIEHMRQHLYEKTSADMSTLAGQAVRTNLDTLTNRLSNSVHTDPSSLGAAFDAIDATVPAMVQSSPNLRATDAGKVQTEITQNLKEKIAKAAFVGAVRNNPDAGMKLANDPKYRDYLSGSDMAKLEQEARAVKRAERVDIMYARTLRNQERDDKSTAAENGVIKNLYSEKPTVTPRDIANNDDLRPATKEKLISIVERETKPETEARVSNKNYLDVLKGIRTGTITDTGAIMDARIAGKLNRADFNQAMKDFTEFKSPDGEALGKDRAEFFKRYAPTIDGAFGEGWGHSALGSQRMYEAEKAARRAEADARTKGQDPHSVYDPSSPNFFGKPANIMKYRASLQDDLAYRKSIGAAPPTPTFTPPPTWQYSASRKQYRDPDSGKVYGLDGKEVK